MNPKLGPIKSNIAFNLNIDKYIIDQNEKPHAD